MTSVRYQLLVLVNLRLEKGLASGAVGCNFGIMLVLKHFLYVLFMLGIGSESVEHFELLAVLRVVLLG